MRLAVDFRSAPASLLRAPSSSQICSLLSQYNLEGSFSPGALNHGTSQCHYGNCWPLEGSRADLIYITAAHQEGYQCTQGDETDEVKR